MPLIATDLSILLGNLQGVIFRCLATRLKVITRLQSLLAKSKSGIQVLMTELDRHLTFGSIVKKASGAVF